MDDYVMPDANKDDREVRKEDLTDAAVAFGDGAVTSIPLPVAIALGIIIGLIGVVIWRIPG